MSHHESSQQASGHRLKRAVRPVHCQPRTSLLVSRACLSAALKMRDSMQKAKLEDMRQTLAYWRGKTPEELAAFGLPETGWENVLFGHLGIDLSTL
jgi:hypothetical protein